MKKLIVFSALALLVFATVGCEKNKEEQKDKCYKLYDEMLLKNNFSEKGVVLYSKDYGEYVIAELAKDGTYSKDNIDLVCPPLAKEFCKEGLKVKIDGKLFSGRIYSSYPNEDLNADGAIAPTYRFKDYKITKLK